MNETEEPRPLTPGTTKSRAKGGEIDPKLEAWIELADACHVEAENPEVAARLVAYDWLFADQKDLGLSLGTCETLIASIQRRRDWKESETEEEKSARKELRIVLDPVFKGARRSYAAGTPQRAAYGIGRSVVGMSALGLLELARHAHSQLVQAKKLAAPADKLQGLLPSEIAAVSAMVIRYQDAPWAQPNSLRATSEYIEFLRKEVEGTLNALRRDLQGAADQAYPHQFPGNAGKRAAFGLPADKPLIG